MLKFFYKFITPIGIANDIEIFKNRVIGKMVNLLYPLYTIIPIKKKVPIDNNVVISLTTYPPRIKEVFYCLNSLLRQNIRPYKVILWLAETQFPNKDSDLPSRILKLKKYGLDIKYCPDYKSYKKIIETAKMYSDKIIVTADDDTLYPENWLKRLLETYSKYSNCIICYRAHEITFSSNGKIQSYKKWNSLSVNKKGPSFYLVPIGVGGILYPKNFFCDVDFNYNIIKKYAPTTDDIWLKVISYKKKFKVVKVDLNSKEWFTINKTQKVSLKNINVETSNSNDIALRALLSFYKIDLEDMKEEK